MSDYPTNLTDKQWQVIKNIVETKERKRKHSLREMINAMHHLRDTVRQACGKQTSPSVGLIDSRSVRTSHHIDSIKYHAPESHPCF